MNTESPERYRTVVRDVRGSTMRVDAMRHDTRLIGSDVSARCMLTRPGRNAATLLFFDEISSDVRRSTPIT